jgi:drug/metabolite transporter (DMT)-like permease
MSRPPRRALAIGALVLANLFWAGNFLVGSTAVDDLGPVDLVWLRWTIAALPLILIAVLVERPDWRAVGRRLPLLIGLSLLGLIGYTLALYEALRFTTAVNASLINALNPALITLASAVLLRSRLSARSIIGMVLGFVGVVIVLTHGSVDALVHLDLNLGDLLMLVAIVVWTAYTLLGRRLRDVAPITATAAQATIAAIVMLPAALIAGIAMPSTGASWGAVLFIGTVPSIGAYILWNSALRNIPPAVAGVFLNLLTVFTVAISAALGTPIGAAEIIGGVLVLGGVALASVPARSAAARPIED